MLRSDATLESPLFRRRDQSSRIGSAKNCPMESEINDVSLNEEDDRAESEKLPDDVLFNVLSRLPVRSLLQLRCVCILWRSVISDPQFIRKHLDRSTKCVDRHRLMITSGSKHYFDSVDCEFGDGAWRRLDLPWKNSNSYAEVLCSCDGLMLLRIHYRPFMSPSKNGEKTFVLWNPSIKKQISFSLVSGSDDCGPIYGLCYDPYSDVYKVVVLSQKFETYVMVFNLQNHCWRERKESRFSVLSRENGVCANGAPHWVMASNKRRSRAVVYFDLEEDKLKELPQPDYGDESNNNDIKLGVLGGWLCICRYLDQTQVEVWAMKDYGEKESWSKLIAIPYMMGTRILRFLKPWWFTKKGEVLVESGKKELFIYHPKDGSISALRTEDGLSSFGVATYIESLVSPGDGDETQTECRAHLKRSIKKGRPILDSAFECWSSLLNLCKY